MWAILTRLVNILWWVWLTATLVVLGYFATLGIGAMQHGVGVSKMITAIYARKSTDQNAPDREGQRVVA